MFKAIEVVEAVKANGGASVRVEDGSGPTERYVVALGKEFASIVPEPEFNESAVRQFVWNYGGALAPVARYLGAWQNEGLVYLDVVETFSDLSQAIRAGVERNQIAIYDTETGEEIPTGGTGEV
jgi:hypothetical protein